MFQTGVGCAECKCFQLPANARISNVMPVFITLKPHLVLKKINGDGSILCNSVI